MSGVGKPAWDGRRSAWGDPLDEPLAALAQRYGARAARDDVEIVRRLRDAVGLQRPRLTVAVVGSNGKTSTATYLDRELRARGLRTGLFTSPHLAYWTQRVAVGGAPVDGAALLEAVRTVDGYAQRRELRDPRLRFFDVLTLAAARLLGEAAVDIAVYEAGIGGRRDATAALEPDLVVLTSIGLEHAELLGGSEEEILVEKLGIARRGSRVVAASLGGRLDALARREADRGGFALEQVQPANEQDSALPRYLVANHALAVAAARRAVELAGGEAVAEGRPSTTPAPVAGRYTEVRLGDVELILDAAHNPQAWDEFLGELAVREGSGLAAVVALTRERPLGVFAERIARTSLFAEVLCTSTSVRPTHRPSAVARALTERGVAARAVAAPESAFAAAAETGRTVAVFGSSYLVTDALSWLRVPAGQASRGHADSAA